MRKLRRSNHQKNKHVNSTKTTLTGVCTILVAVASAAKAILDGDPATVPDWTSTITAITAGFGLIFARDNNVTSEQAGAGK